MIKKDKKIQQKRLFNFFQIIGIDRAILMVIGARGWSLIAGPLTIYFLVRYISNAEQGFYYTFGSILGIKVFFELGLGNVTLLAASHEASKLNWNDGMLEGDQHALERISSLFRKASKIYMLISTAVPMMVWPVGYYFFCKNEHADTILWQGPWLLLCVLTAANLWSAFITSFLEGCGKVQEISRLRLQVAIVASLSSWAVLSLGGSLYCAAAAVATDLLLVGVYLAVKYRNVFNFLFKLGISETNHLFSWRKEVWPMQWRTAISFVSGYLMFQLFNPIVFHFCGAKEAGRMGMSINLASAALTASLAWINTKASNFGSLAANRSWNELDRLFFTTLKQSFCVLVILLVILLFGHVFLQSFMPIYSDRLLGFSSFFMLLSATAGNHLLFSMALYLRSHRQDPLVLLSVISGLLITASSIIAASISGTLGVTLSYALVTWVVGVGWGTIIFRSCRLKWHRN